MVRQKDLEILMEETFTPDNFPTEQKSEYEKAIANCTTMIMSSIDTTVMELIPHNTFEQSIFGITQSLETVLIMDNDVTHKVLKSEAKDITL